MCLRCQELPWRKDDWRCLTFPKQRPIQLNLEPIDLEESDLASVICQLVESDDTLRKIFFGSMSSLNPFPNMVETTIYLVLFTWALSYCYGCAAAPSRRSAVMSEAELGKQKPLNNMCYSF